MDSPSEINGSALEGLVAQHLRAWIDYSKNRYSLHFWRTKSGVEVDFILFGPDAFWAIEVKNSAIIHPKDTHGLGSFWEDYPEARAILLYNGKERMIKKNVLCIPCEEFRAAIFDQIIPWNKSMFSLLLLSFLSSYIDKIQRLYLNYDRIKLK